MNELGINPGSETTTEQGECHVKGNHATIQQWSDEVEENEEPNVGGEGFALHLTLHFRKGKYALETKCDSEYS